MSDPDDVPKPLTLAFVRHVTTPGRYYDQDGLILTVSPSGAKSWTQRLTIQGRRRDIGLGSARVVTPAQARSLAAKNKAVARAGGDPLAPKAAHATRVVGRGQTITFAAFTATRHRRLRASPRAATDHVQETYQRVRLHTQPILGHLSVAEITPDDIAQTLLALARKSRTTARWLRVRLTLIFDDAVSEGLRRDNPVRAAAVAELEALVPEQVAKDDEGQRILARLPDFLWKLEQDTRRSSIFLMVRFCLLSMRHPKECRLAMWPQFDLKGRMWRFPAMQRPDGPVVELGLHEDLLEILDRARRLGQGDLTSFVFPSSQASRGGAFSDGSISTGLKIAGYDLVPMDFQRAHKAWIATEGGDPGDLVAWAKRLRPV